MAGVLFLLRTWPWRQRAALAGVAVLGAVSVGFVLLAGLGAHRSATAWEGLRQRALDVDAILDVTSIDGARRVAARARDVPGVARAVPMAYSRLVPEGRQDDFLGGAILTLEPGGFEELLRPVLTAGRRADQRRVGEVVVNERFVEMAGLGVGSRYTMVDPFGLISQPVTIVGIGVLPNDFTLDAGYPAAYPTSAFTRAWNAELGQLFDAAGNKAIGPGVFIARAEGADPAQTRAGLLATLADDDLVEVTDVSVTAAQVVDTLRLQRNGYLSLAVVGGLATLSILALVLARVTRTQPTEANALSALGFTGRDLRFAVLVPGALAAAAALVGATVVVALGESLVPTGLAQRVGVGRQVGDDAGFFAMSGIATAAALAGLLAAVAWRAPREVPSAAPSPRPRSGALAWPSVGAGLRAATGGLASAGRRHARPLARPWPSGASASSPSTWSGNHGRGCAPTSPARGSSSTSTSTATPGRRLRLSTGKRSWRHRRSPASPPLSRSGRGSTISASPASR